MLNKNIKLNGYDDFPLRKYSSDTIIELTNDTPLIINEFIPAVKNTKWKLGIFCEKCGREYKADLYEFAAGAQRCCLSQENKNNLLRDKHASTPEQIRKMTIDQTDGEYECVNSEAYINNNTKLKFQHNECGTISIISWNKFQHRGQRCKECTRFGGSIPENNFEDILKHFNIEYIGQKKYKDCKNDKTEIMLPFDFYIPKLQALIEVDGPQHRRPSYGEEAFKEQKYRDSIKNEYAENKKIRLIRVKHDGWNDEVFQALINIVTEVLGEKIALCDVEDNIFSTTMEIQKARIAQERGEEYLILDNLFKGVDSYYNVLHTICGTEFSIIYDKLRSGVQSCPICTIKKRKENSFNKLDNDIKSRFINYKLVKHSDISLKPGKVFLECTHCDKSYGVYLSNFNRGEGGCPQCRENNPKMHWIYKLNTINNNTLSKTQKIWINNQHERHRVGSLTKWELSHIKNNKYAYNLICKGVKILHSTKEHT